MRKHLIILSACVLLGLISTILFIEILYHAKIPTVTLDNFHQLKKFNEKNYYENYFKKAFTIDDDIGFRPILGTEFFNQYGTRVNDYPIEKRQDFVRVLFMGDSVTEAGYIISGLKHYYGDKNYEYWNAGVGSYNTVQEVNYYKRYNFTILPDEVVLTFVFNDFEITPIAFFLSPDDLVVFSPNKTIHNMSPFLFKNSYIYRFYIGYLMSQKKQGYLDNEEVKSSLLELKNILEKDNIKLTVIISPYLKPYNSWENYEKNNRKKIVSILNDLKIRYFDLSHLVEQAVNEMIILRDDYTNITHPSRELGLYFAKYLYENKLLSNK